MLLSCAVSGHEACTWNHFLLDRSGYLEALSLGSLYDSQAPALCPGSPWTGRRGALSTGCLGWGRRLRLRSARYWRGHWNPFKQVRLHFSLDVRDVFVVVINFS